jgi:hypothetical protein
MNVTETMIDRLKAALDRKGLSPRQASVACNRDPTWLPRLLDQQRKFPTQTMDEICDKLDIPDYEVLGLVMAE